jgi:hypothetical protein
MACGRVGKTGQISSVNGSKMVVKIEMFYYHPLSGKMGGRFMGQLQLVLIALIVVR